jgi:vancomycin resistance protein YoaR
MLCCILFAGTSDSGELHILSSFTTSVEGQDENVKRNIHIACRKIDGYVIPPGGVFSFNDVVGEGSLANGFMDGRVLYMDHVKHEPGGGLCQVSSTLYNAFLAAGFALRERHRHYQPVSYVPLGLDATIKYGKKNLRMINPHGFSVSVGAGVNDRSLVVVLRASASLPFKYEIFTEEEEIEVPLQSGNDDIRNGIRVLVFRKKYEKDRLVENRLLYRDYYPPVYLRRE